MPTENDHPSDEELAAFLDRALSAPHRERIARHLVKCDECRVLVGGVGITGAATSPPTRSALRRLVPLAAGLAAVALIVVNTTARSRGAANATDQLRGDTAQAIEEPVLAVHAPADGARVRVDTLKLRWASAGADATYGVSIVDADGDEIWSTRTTIPEVALPPETQRLMRASETYYWRADALLRDLRTASTGPHGFVPIDR